VTIVKGILRFAAARTASITCAENLGAFAVVDSFEYDLRFKAIA